MLLDEPTQGTLAAVRQVDGDFIRQVVQPHLGEQLHGAVVQLAQAAFAAPEVEGGAQLALQAQPHVFDQREVGEHRRNLEGSDDPTARNLRGRLCRDVVPVELDRARCRHQKFGEQIEAGRLARSVGSDQRVNGAPADSQVHVADSSEAFELFGQALCFKDHVTHWAWFTPWCGKKIRLH